MDRPAARLSRTAAPPAETVLRLGAVAVLLAAAGGLGLPGHGGLFAPLALLAVLAAVLLPDRGPLQGPAVAFAEAPGRPQRAVRTSLAR